MRPVNGQKFPDNKFSLYGIINFIWRQALPIIFRNSRLKFFKPLP